MSVDNDLQPRAGTVLTNEGKVVFRDVTRYGLHRMCVEAAGKYPDVEAWLEMVSPQNDVKLMRYTERVNGPVLVGYLWLFWKTAPTPQLATHLTTASQSAPQMRTSAEFGGSE